MRVRIERNPRDGSAYFYPEDGDVAIAWCPRDMVSQLHAFFERLDELDRLVEVDRMRADIRNALVTLALIVDGLDNDSQDIADGEYAIARIKELLGPVQGMR